MRKLVLFGVLGGVFLLALLLEHFVTRPVPRRSDDSDHLVAIFGGLPPREIPATPPDDPPGPPAATPAGDRGDPNERSKRAKGATGGGERPADPPAAQAKEHVVEKGETLASIARARLGSANRWRDLALWNGIADPGTLQSGVHLRLAPPDDSARADTAKSDSRSEPRSEKNPSPANGAAKEKGPVAGDRTHRIARGDTLSHIATQYLGDASRWREIQRLNNIADPANLTEGRTLQLPQR
jgi:nucleoid-associated protein YgaU